MRELLSDGKVVGTVMAGHNPSLDNLVVQVRTRVYAYLRRVTLDENRADELTEATVIAVLESLGGLGREPFWPWVLRIATIKAREHPQS
jgi:DNA-directed RNA polymerase specialized sigma24 family protein